MTLGQSSKIPKTSKSYLKNFIRCQPLNLLHEKFPEAELIELEQLHFPSKIILLYPDSIGLGWRKMERRVKVHRQKLSVLNLRRRIFEFTHHRRRTLYLRRFLDLTRLERCLTQIKIGL
jgi:hypothetical protein